MKSAVAIPSDGAAHNGTGETSLESFVAQLHRDGVAAGQQEAERLVREALERAAEVLRRSQAEAEALLTAAREQAAREQERGRAELALAARNTLLQLESAIAGVLEALLTREVERVLGDPAFVKGLVTEVISAYARADAAERPTAVHLPYAMAREFESWTADLLAAGLRADAEVTATLRDVGFEYRLSSGSTVEVTGAAVVERLLELLPPRLRETVAGALQEPAQAVGAGRPTGPHAP